jgi:hypothetical protein
MISFHSQLKVCGNRILKSIINVITAAKRYNLRPGTWCSRMCLQPTLEFQMWQSSGKVPVVSRYSIGPVLATPPVLPTNPSYSLKTYRICFVFFIKHNILSLDTCINFGSVLRCSASAGISLMQAEQPFGAIQNFWHVVGIASGTTLSKRCLHYKSMLKFVNFPCLLQGNWCRNGDGRKGWISCCNTAQPKQAIGSNTWHCAVLHRIS